MDWTAAFQRVYGFLQRHEMTGWMLEVFLVVCAAAAANMVLARILERLGRQTARTRNVWDDALIEAARRPLRLLIWVVGIGFAGEIIRHDTGAALFSAVPALRTLGVIGALVWFVVRLISELETSLVAERQARGESIDLTTAKALARLLRVSVLITGSLIALQSLGFSISGVLAFGGIGGIAIGFAAKDILANFFGGLMLYLDRPFAVGDWISSPDRDIEGTVEDIGWRLTRIRRFDKRPVYVPNSMFASMAVVNPSRMTHRRIYETVGIRYDDLAVLGRIVQAVETMLRARQDIDTEQTLMVYFNGFRDSSCDFMIYCFTRTTQWAEYLAVRQAVMLEIAEIVERYGAEIAFPTRTLHIAGPVAMQAGEGA
ncbi:mechanosensitive ion channel family protein [Acidihalobacter aeolianus]|nr:mechanosensitive ion channel family protein [Acidihalobacter aeolianus]